MWDNFKAFLTDDAVFYGLLILLIGSTSFGLGRWSMIEEVPQKQAAGVVMTETGQEAGGIVDAVPTSLPGQFVGSKNGSKYHLPWCPGAQQMKEENKVWFTDKSAAEVAGYSPAGNCKGI